MDARLQLRVQRYGWDRAAALYERYWQRQLAPAQDCLLALANIQPGERVLDVACGTGLVGMWKAFAELAGLGWLERPQRPRMVSVQAEGCAPIVRAFGAGAPRAAFFENATTLAAGLRVPGPFADQQILRALRESWGTAVAVSDTEILAAQHQMAVEEGLLAAPEGAATLAGLARLVAQGWVRPDERVVLFNTGSGLKYLEA